MSYVIIIGLIVVVVALMWIATEQERAIEKYEKELISKAKKGKK